MAEFCISWHMWSPRMARVTEKRHFNRNGLVSLAMRCLRWSDLRVEGPKVGHQLGILSPVTFQPSMLVAGPRSEFASLWL